MLKSEMNPEERPGLQEGETSYRTPANTVEVRCGMCGGLFYVDEATATAVDFASRAGLDNPFMCADCRDEYDEFAYEG
jgi:hypothetical protein